MSSLTILENYFKRVMVMDTTFEASLDDEDEEKGVLLKSLQQFVQLILQLLQFWHLLVQIE